MTQATLYNCYIKQCTIPDCTTWFIGSPRSRYCQPHKRSQYEHMVNNHNGNHQRSRFTEKEIREIRRLFLTYSAAELAQRYNCNRSLIYKYVHQDPERYRQE